MVVPSAAGRLQIREGFVKYQEVYQGLCRFGWPPIVGLFGRHALTVDGQGPLPGFYAVYS
jgi:hypothetical protein